MPQATRTSLAKFLADLAPNADDSAVTEAARFIDAVANAETEVPGWDERLFVGWQTSPRGVRLVRRAVRVALHCNGLPATGELFERAYGYVLEHY